MNKDVQSRLLRGLSANAMLPLVTAIIQLCSVPVFLKYWGVTLYGEWLVLSAVPAYLTMCDLGFCNGSANEMTIQVASGDKDRALETFQSTWLMITALSFMLGLISFLLIEFLPITHWFHIGSLSRKEMGWVLILLTVYVLLDQQMQLLAAGFRCEMHYAFSSILFNVIRLAEFLAVCAVVMHGAGPVQAAFTLLVSRSIGAVVLRLALRSRSPWLVYGWRHFRIDVLKAMLAPAFGFLCMPLGHAVSLQGMLMVIGALCGPAGVVIFSTSRTLTRWGFQMTNMIFLSFSPEMSRAWGIRDRSLARKLHAKCVAAAVGVTSVVLLALAIFGKWALAVWTQDKVEFVAPMFMALLLSVLASSVWYSSAVVPMASNRHQKLGIVYLSLMLLSLVLAFALISIWEVTGAACAVLVGDCVMAVYVLYTSTQQLREDRWAKALRTRRSSVRSIMNALIGEGEY
ncbi:MAG TPA: hypothetical protein VGP72_09790 [Planctomycetota bacterium]|jgi:O-antigen/teichoic acid export membrane protein